MVDGGAAATADGGAAATAEKIKKKYTNTRT
jgi:hypothetical protein